MNTKWNLFSLLGKRAGVESADAGRTCDPLDHPELRRMTLAELADLPMPTYARKTCNACV
jgi:hypothetical protein